MRELNQLLRHELDCCDRLIRLTLQLESSVDRGETDRVEFFLGERGKVLTRISGIQEKIESLSRGSQYEVSENIGKQRLLGEKMRYSLEKVLAIDRRIGEKIKKDWNSEGSKLGLLRRGRIALKGYMPLKILPRFLDRRL